MSQNEVESRKKRCGLTPERITGEILLVCQDFISAGIGAGREAKYVLSDGIVTGFRKMSPHLSDFNRDEQIFMSRYAFNTKESLLADLLEVQRVMRNLQLTQIISSTCKKLSINRKSGTWSDKTSSSP